MRSDYLRALRINRCEKKKTTVHNWKKNDRPDSTSANCGHPTVQKKVLEESSTSSSLDTSAICPGAREQIFLHGWITCHANNQGRKELSNALPFARIACWNLQLLQLKNWNSKPCKMKNRSLPWTTGSWKNPTVSSSATPGIVPSSPSLQDQPEHNHRLPP